jgi:tetratricopeptide (TPR) repeat protein
MPVDPERVQAIFLEAAEQDSPAGRAAVLDRQCGSDAELRRRVETLLKAHEAPGPFLESRAPVLAGTVDEPRVTEGPGTGIGPYKLIEQVGEGGMGTVWMAQQTEPVKRLVALKLIKAGMDSKQVIARFEAERQALALMDHPNIARVLDGGTTSAGRPYFVMDLVKGVPITRYCDEHRLTLRQRLELFLPVCEAVQHAHQKGVIHRDLKPSNVLVALYDGKPVPKVIDFGVAKAAGQALTEKSLVTGFGAIVGTLEYMSPEQAQINQLDVDTRSDIYALGVLLYELLTGTTPLERKRVKEAGLLEALRIIREEETPRPSTRLSTAEEVPTIAANRGTDPKKLSALFRGELDWIVMKALEKDRNRRYETANGFAADVQRYLADEPVLACPPSAGYRLRKFARRNKGGLAAAALVLSFLVLTGSGVGWAVRDRAAREEEVARQQEQRQAKVAGEVGSILAEVDRLEKEQRWPEALAAARRAGAAVAGGEADAETAQRVRQRLRDLELIDRLEQIRMEQIRMDQRAGIAERDRAYARAFRDYGVDVEELAVEASIERLKARPALAIPLAAALDEWVFWPRGGVSEWTGAGKKRLLAVARGIDPEPLRDWLRSAQGRPASQTRDELRRLADSINVRAHPPVTLVGLARTLMRVRQSGLAVRVLRDAQFVYPGDFWLAFELGGALSRQKDHEEAVRFFTAAVSIRPESTAYGGLGDALREWGKLDEAIAAYRKAIERAPSSREAASNYVDLGIALRLQKKPDEAMAACRKAIDLSPTFTTAYRHLALDLRARGKLDEAAGVYRKLIEIHPNSSIAYNHLGFALRDLKKPNEANAAFDKAIELARKRVELNPKSTHEHWQLASILRAQGKLDEAIDAYRKGLAIDPRNAGLHNHLGLTLRARKKWAEAIDAYRNAIKFDPMTALYYSNLGVALLDQNKTGEAIDAYRKAVELDPKSAGAHNNLGAALAKQGQLDDAVAALRKAIELDPKHAPAYSNLRKALKDLAWALATDPVPARRDPRRAVSVAREAVEMSPQEGDYHNTLGVALYRAERWKEAVATLEKSMELRKGGDSNDWFFLAMAHWKLGKKEKAREWYDRAVQWMDKNQRKNEQVRRFRAEAADLLGLTEKK